MKDIEIHEMELPLSVEKLEALASEKRSIPAKELGLLTLASEDEKIFEEEERGDVTITVDAIPPEISTPKNIKNEYKFTTEHVVKVVNNSNKGFEERVFIEWQIPNAYRIKGGYQLYCPKGKTTVSRESLVSDWFNFGQVGKYKLYASTSFKGESKTTSSNEFEVVKNTRNARGAEKADGWDWVELEKNASPNGYKLVVMAAGVFLEAQDVEYGGVRLNGKYYTTAYITINGVERERKEKLTYTDGDSNRMKLADSEEGLVVNKVGVSIPT